MSQIKLELPPPPKYVFRQRLFRLPVQILPDNVLRARVCQECFQYLSVGPISINNKGESICGRCNAGQTVPLTKSLHGILAQKFKFKCTNHINGCKELIIPDEMEDHENNCSYPPQDCFFCSFSGNLSQIVNHSLKYHPKNITFDGTFLFSLSEAKSKKTLLYLFDDNLYVITIEVTEELVKISIQLQNGKLTTNQYGIKFFKSDDPSNSVFILTEYGLLHDKFPSYFEKSVEHLITSFGSSGATLCCQILIKDFKLISKYLDIQKRYSILRKGEDKLAQLQALFQDNVESYNTAINIIKIISHSLFKCINCNTKFPADMYYCPSIHVYCENCLESICKECKIPREYKSFMDLENFEIPCDYANCNKNIKIKEYLFHEVECPKRPYKCPLQNCSEVVLSANGLIEHWHSEMPKLCVENEIKLESFKSQEFYWLVESDLYHVLVEIGNGNISVFIDEINALNKIKFVCYFCNDDDDDEFWYEIPMQLFCGKHIINSNTCCSLLKITYNMDL